RIVRNPPLEELAPTFLSSVAPLGGTFAPKKLSSARPGIDTPSLGPSAFSFSRGGACPRTAPSEPPHRAKSARWGPRGCSAKKRLSRATPPRPAGRGPQRGSRVGVPRRPVRGHPREAKCDSFVAARPRTVSKDLRRGRF